MKNRIIIAIFACVAVLSCGCAVSSIGSAILTDNSPVESSQLPMPSLSPTHSQPPIPEEIHDNSLELIFSYEVDMDGDGVDDVVNVYKIGWHNYNEDGEELFDYYVPTHRVLVEIIVCDTTFTWLYGNNDNSGEFSYSTTAFILKTVDGKNCIVLGMDTGGTGYGSSALRVLAFNGEIYELPIPAFYGGGYGFEAEVTFVDGFKVDVFVPETEVIAGALEISEEYREYFCSDFNYYDENGKVNGEHCAWTDWICSFGIRPITLDGQECVVITQYIWGISHPLGIGFLNSAITWDGIEYIVIGHSVSYDFNTDFEHYPWK